MRQIIWILAIFLNISQLQAQQSETILIGEVLNKAGSERMLTQRMAKLYIALYLGTDIKESKAALDATVSLFDTRLIDLKTIKINARYTKRIERVNHLWGTYRALILSRPTKENILLLLKENNVILESCELLTNELEWHASRFSSKNGLYQMNENVMHLENRAGRQRMLTERVLFYFLANHALIGADSKFDKELNLALDDYQINLTALMGATENTPEIDYRLILLSKEWEALSFSCHQKEKDFSNIEGVLKMGKDLLKSMEEITKSYEVLIDLRVASLLLNNAIDLAGQQNILTQKITKTYILEGLTENSKYEKERKSDVSLFEQNMDELKLFAPMEEITEALNVVDNLWTNYRNEVMNPSTKAGAKELLYANSELLMASKNVTKLLEMYAKMYKKSVTSYNYVMVDWIKQIGHQEMLTERILMYSYALSWGIKKDAIPKELDRAGREYLENFNVLSLAIPIPNMQERGERLAEKWEVVKTYLSDLGRYQEELNEWSADLSKELGDLTKLYREKIKGMVAEEAVEKANQQCMLSQKMASNYLAVGMNLNGQYQRQQLEKDKLLFQKQLEELK
ncbi:MAG: type IV pili methyl-accepting chemotaxis transducer N-terminal domain-containing protein, partial [Aureispira sp.]|nr:type IV pili methyl-accepting chemotaxis transducer N-terminal domain-containing protein [Aureispira sp.]